MKAVPKSRPQAAALEALGAAFRAPEAVQVP